MSSTAHAHESGGDHVPHVLPLSAYFGVFVGLLIFTAITVGVSYIDLGPANLFIAMAVATCKALMVSLIFMHLAFDKKFNLVIFMSAVIFLGIFISLTMFDTNWRDLGGRTSEDRPADVASPFSGTMSEANLKAKYEHKEEPASRGGGEAEHVSAGAAVAQTTQLKGDAAAGKAVFQANCVLCHGAEGKGDGPAAAALNPKPMNFNDATRMAGVTDEKLLKAITEGGAAVGVSPVMPAFKASLSSKQIEDVATYIRHSFTH